MNDAIIKLNFNFCLCKFHLNNFRSLQINLLDFCFAVPTSSGTKAGRTRFYDDKSTWTTTAVNGGPTNVDAYKMNFSDLTNRDNKADHRGMTPIRIRRTR